MELGEKMKAINVLDHGFVRLVEAWGHGDVGQQNLTLGQFEDGIKEDADFEVGIIEAARQSTQGSFRGWDEDETLLRYLYENKHATPFEFAGLVIEVRAPIFVFREWHRHRTQSFNEMSARYSPLPYLNYIPTKERIALKQGKNKQASGIAPLNEGSPEIFREVLKNYYAQGEEIYQQALVSGIPKELARVALPVGRYSQMRASTSLRNWLGFLTLRLDPAAQWEIRQYANAVGEIIANVFPQTWSLFCEGRK